MIVSAVWESKCSHRVIYIQLIFSEQDNQQDRFSVVSPAAPPSRIFLSNPAFPQLSFSFSIRHTSHFHLKQPNPHCVLCWHCVIWQGRDCDLKNFRELEEWEDLFILGIAHCSRGSGHSAVPQCIFHFENTFWDFTYIKKSMTDLTWEISFVKPVIGKLIIS